ncbi:prepilin-type N-terminal cleavage/methylation domain-containing protein [Candidatus Saganbacteria bacterium]|nr:prepilin-type N-terminal cleavage/methylation domain-containing protein [Candidatus Saganbacteria bacterium]
MIRPAFTLIEVVICLSLVGVIAVAALAAAAGFSGSWNLRAASRSLASELRHIQSLAVSQHQTLSFKPDRCKLPAGIILTKTSSITFAPSGQTPPGGAGTLIITNRRGQSKKIIVSTAGRVRIE